jgi:hypothetical protein
LNDNHEEFVSRWPETLVCWQGIRHQQTRDATGELLHLILHRDVRAGRNSNRRRAWEHQMMACAGLLTHLESEEESDESGRPYASAPHLTYWAPVSRVTARSRGQGLPTTHWQLSQDTVQNHAGHREDYLYYRVPLRGDFEIECEVTSFDFRDTQLLCAGNWVAPSYELKSCTVGDLRRQLRVGELSPPMSLVDRWMRHRTVVRDGACTTWLNGRRIHEQPLEAAHDPWLAVRSTWITTGAVRSVRVTGTPQIPGAINLASLPELSGWSSYYERSVGGGDSEWTHVSAVGGIFGRLQPALRGSGVECLLHYHRPMLEDGTIEYDFFYREGQTRTSALGTTSDEATSGHLRLARRGETFYCLFAENDSSQYRLVHEEEIGKEKLLSDGIRLTTAVLSGDDKSGTTTIVWKELTVRAENIVP